MRLSTKVARALIGRAYATPALAGEAKKLLGELQEFTKTIYVEPFLFACIYFGLGEIDKGLDCLEKAVEERYGYVLPIQVDLGFDRLHSPLCFQALLRKMNLQP